MRTRTSTLVYYLIALIVKLKKRLNFSQGNGMIAVNVMKAVTDYEALVEPACEPALTPSSWVESTTRPA
ncbi:hypothetical protein OURE66S_02534 [Oligella ureolytica]